MQKIRRHNWENGTSRGSFTTTNNQFLQYDSKGAKVANIPLSEEYKADLNGATHYELGKGKVNLISTQFNSYLNTTGFKPIRSDGKLKNSSINFNPRSGEIKGKTVYMRDYTDKCEEY